MIEHSRLLERLNYNKETGEFTYLPRKVEEFLLPKFHKIWISRFCGKVAGSKVSENHPVVQIGLDGEKYLAHRLAWFWMTGKWPEDTIDHINRDSLDNRWGNLRDVTHSINMRNRKLSSNNISGYHGVYWNKKNKCWIVNTYHGNKTKYHGSYSNLEDAIDMRKQFEIQNDYYPTHGGL